MKLTSAERDGRSQLIPGVGRTQKDNRVAPQVWINAALRSVIWLGVAVGWAYLKKPDEASLLGVRTDAIGWLGAGIVLAGLTLHFWSSATLVRGERQGAPASTLVKDGPFRYVRNPIYLAGVTLLLGVGVLYLPWRVVDQGLPLLLLAYFHVAVVRLEEPELRRRFGSKYEEYCERVPRWLPVPMSRGAAQQRHEADER
jgi:protein-S-isoprenylcysteine O-methyltransferase Ste14